MQSVFMSSNWECSIQWSQHLRAVALKGLMFYVECNFSQKIVGFVISSLKDSPSSHC